MSFPGASVFAALVLAASVQETGVLRVTVILTDADGNVTPIPRVVLLVSENPAAAEPRRIRTGPDGVVELKVRPGNYTVESDVPVTLGGQAYVWTQMIDVPAGRETVLALTARNAAIEAAAPESPESPAAGGPAAPIRADGAAIFSKWQRSIVEIWTPTMHATGFLIDERGLIATNDRALGDASTVAVEFTQAPGPKTQVPRMKVAGRVVASDRPHGVAIVAIDPRAMAAVTPLSPRCGAEPAPIEFEDRIVTIAAPILAPRDVIQGTVGRTEARSFAVDWRLMRGSAGSPVFAADGAMVGMTIADDERDEREGRRRDDSRVVPISNVCNALAAAAKAIAAAAPPPATALRVEPAHAPLEQPTPVDPKAPRMQATTISASNFDITLLTPAMVRGEATSASPRTDFGNWSDYVAAEPPVLLVRVTPQFEESLWKTIARGAAQTQGVPLPPMKSFTANFLRMRAFCGATEVAPIQPLVIERRVSETAAIREGLYVFATTDFGPHCSAVRFDVYSAKAPEKADSRTIDPQLFPKIVEQRPGGFRW